MSSLKTRDMEVRMQNNDPHYSQQSAYQRDNLIETSLLTVNGDIAENLDKGVMFDLSVAFDVIDHAMLIKRLGIPSSSTKMSCLR